MKEFIHDFIQTVLMRLTDLGYWGIMIGLMLEVIPSEIVLSYGGYLVSQGKITFWGAVFFGTVGGTIAQIFVYWIGKYGGRPFLEKYGKYLFIHKKHIDLSEQWFNRYGTGVIFTARFIPVVRHAISIPAGIANMSLLRFTVLTTLAVIPWSMLFIYLGLTLGDKWQQIDQAAAPYIKPFMWSALALMLLYVGYKFYKTRQGKKNSKYGDAGERITAHQLKFIGKEYKVMHSRRLRVDGGSQEFDHIVVGPGGVFHIDSKHWAGEIRFNEDGVQRSKGSTNEDPTGQMYRHEYVIKEILRRNHVKADVAGIICFTHPNCEVIAKNPAFAVLKPDRLLHFIKTCKTKNPLDGEQVRFIAKLIEDHSRQA